MSLPLWRLGLLAFAFAASPALADRRYTVDDMLAVESIGSARFDPSGRILVYEHLRPFGQQADFGRQYVVGETRSRIFSVALDRPDAARPLFDQDARAGHTIGGMSPDGTRLVVNRVSGEGLATGVVSLDGGALTPFDMAPAYNGIHDAPWIGTQVILNAGTPGRLDLYAAISSERLDDLSGLWRERNRGTTPTAQAIGSGRFASLPTPRGGIVIADSPTGGTRTLLSGSYEAWYPSPDGGMVAALRSDRMALDPDQLIEHGANMGASLRRLVIAPTRAEAGASVEPCSTCDILRNSLSWSSAAPLLTFYARPDGRPWLEARHFVFDARTGRAQPVDLGPLRPHAFRDPGGIRLVSQSTWLGSDLVVLAEAAAAPEVEPGRRRADWYLLADGAQRNLTAAFAGKAPELIAVTRDALVVLHNGDAWRVGRDGARVNLTASVDAPVRRWAPPGPYGTPAIEDLRPVDVATVQAVPAGSAAPSHLVFIDLAGARADTLAMPTDTRILAVSNVTRSAAIVQRRSNVSTLAVIGTDGSRRDIVRLNTHLEDVVGGTPVRIDHRGPNGDPRISWVLLPPGRRPGERVPTVVNVYPGDVGRDSWNKWRLDTVHPLNDQVLAGHGYAILYPSLPVRYDDVPRDPLAGLDREVLAAVDAAIAQGYVDPDRMALQGQSYGGYTTAAVVSMTNRFRAAVAQAGVYDLISFYGTFDARRRLDVSETGLDMTWVSHLETSQGGMGAAPWADPERYIRNSPIMRVRGIRTPILLMTGDQDSVSTTQTEELFTALTRLNRDARFVRYFGEDHIFNSAANIRDAWQRIIGWYDQLLALRPTDASNPN